MELDKEQWQFYLINNGPYTYAGVSPDPVKRLRKHNGEISGGAKYTTSKGTGWKHICLVKGFPTKIEALQFEWAVKHVAPRNLGGLNNRMSKVYRVLCAERWTSKSPLACEVDLEIDWKIDILENVKDIALPENVKIQV